MYNLAMNGKYFATGLSKGEFSQALLDLERELDESQRKEFYLSLGYDSESVDFESFVYDELNVDGSLETMHKENILLIEVE